MAESTQIKTISDFDSGEFHFLSNFYTDDGDMATRLWGYPTSEHAFQAFKFPKGSPVRERIRACSTPGEAKRVAWSSGKPREDWDDMRDEVMMTVCMAKFAPGSELAAKLMATGDRPLIEGNRRHDTHWGDCICPRHRTEPGDNMLGQILMWIRASLLADAAVEETG